MIAGRMLHVKFTETVPDGLPREMVLDADRRSNAESLLSYIFSSVPVSILFIDETLDNVASYDTIITIGSESYYAFASFVDKVVRG